MKKFIVASFLIALAFVVSTGLAATNISFDAAAAPGANPDASVNGEGPATADAWTIVSAFGGAGDLFGPGLSDGTYSNDNTWQIFTVSGQDSQIYSKHTLDSPLNVGQSISLDFANSGVAPPPSTGANPGVVGISLKDSNNVNIAQFSFRGGSADYVYSDAIANNMDTLHPFEFQDLMQITWTIGPGGTYLATLADPGTHTIEDSWAGVLGGNGTVAGIEVFNNNGGNNSDVFYDDLTVVPEPTTWIAGVAALAGCIYLRRRSRTA